MVTPVDRHVGARLRRARQARGLTQPALGTRVGVSFQQIQKYENGSSRIGASRLWACAVALGVGPEWFFLGLSAAQGTSRIPGENAGESEPVPDYPFMDWAYEFDALPDHVVTALLTLARATNRKPP